MKSGNSIGLLILLEAALCCQAANWDGKPEPNASLTGIGAGNSVVLPDKNIMKGSDSVYCRDSLLNRDCDYVMDYRLGLLYLAGNWSSSDTFMIYYRSIPFALPEKAVYMPAKRSWETKSDSVSRPARLPWNAAPDLKEWLYEKNGAVRLGGAKSLTVTAGSGRDVALDQALQVSINGRLSPTLEVNASLSDQNMPLSAGGSTQELSQMDKVYLQAKGGFWETVLGDYELDYQGTSYYHIRRQLQGVTGNADGNGNQIRLAAAVSKGKRAVSNLTGIEGQQGPYRLYTGESSGGFRVLPGSEKVWLDGIEMKKGESQDYMVDYEQGTISFNPARPVHSDSRITVDFEYSGQNYQRNYYAVSTEARPLGFWTLKGGYQQEGDDPDRPLFGELADSDKHLLALAGDDTARLWVDGGIMTDSGQGTYVLSDSFYTYVGHGLGNYQVTFTWVGEGQGDYRDSLGILVYAGKGAGEYLALKKLSAPSLSRLYSVGSYFTWRGGMASVAGAGTALDKNVASPLEDTDNQGLSGAASFSWKRDSLVWGGFEAAGRITQASTDFDRALLPASPDFSERWQLYNWTGLKPLNADQLEKTREIRMAVGPSIAKVLGEWGRLDLQGGIWSRRYAAGLNSHPLNPLEVSYRYQQIRIGNAWVEGPDQGKRDLHKIDAGLSLRHWECSGGFLHSTDLISSPNAADNGQRFYQGSTGLGWKGQAVNARIITQRREDFRKDSLTSGFLSSSYTQDLKSSLGLVLGEGISGSVEHSFRRLAYRSGTPGLDLNTHLGKLDLSYAPPSAPVRTSLNYSAGTSESRLKREIYLLVPSGTGEYSYDQATGNFYPDTTGSYIKQIKEEGTGSIATDLAAKAYFSYSPLAEPGRSPWSRLRLEFSASAAVKTVRPVNFKLLSFDPGYWWDRTKNNSSGLDLAGDLWYVLMTTLNARLHLRYKRDDDNQYINRRFTRYLKEQRCELASQFGPSSRGTVYGECVLNNSLSVEYGLESQSRVYKLGSEINQLFGRSVNVGVKTFWARENLIRQVYSYSPFTISYNEFSALPYANRAIGREGNLRLEVSHIYRQADRAKNLIPLEFSLGRPLGLTMGWRLQFEYRMNNYLTSSLSYDAKKEAGQRIVHNARAEMRANF